MMVGREQLYRWLTLSLFRVGSHRERDEALLELALARARFIELLVEQQLSKAQAGEAFFVGLLSMRDCLLSQSLEIILSRLNVAEHVASVLRRSEGPYAPCVRLALAVEQGQRRARPPNWRPRWGSMVERCRRRRWRRSPGPRGPSAQWLKVNPVGTPP